MWKADDESEREYEDRRFIEDYGKPPPENRYAHTMLPDEQLSRFFAYKLANENTLEWKRICDTMDQLEVFEAFAMRRTSYYLSLEKKREHD